MEIKFIIYTLYQSFTNTITKESSWTSSDKTDETVERFLCRWEKRGIRRESLGISFLYDYFCDSYNFWTNSGRDLKVIPLNYIIGEPQLGRWDRRCEEYVFSYREGLLSSANFPRLSELKKLIRPEVRVRDISEEYERGRFLNTPEGFIHCILTTSLYSPESKACNDCKSKNNCIEELKIRNTELALERGLIKL